MADPSTHTKARPVKITDEDWAWLGQYAEDNGTDRASIIRRLVTLLRGDAAELHTRRSWRLHSRVLSIPDPVGDRRNANLTGGRA